MDFDTHPGSRGGRKMRAGTVSRWMQQRMLRRARGGRAFMGMDLLVLQTVGRRSGQQRETAVSWFPDSDGAWLIVASAGGSAHPPDWYHNLAAHPDQVHVDLPGRGTIPVTAEQLDGTRRNEAWLRIVQAQPRFAKYQAKTDRVLPVIRLSATGEA